MMNCGVKIIAIAKLLIFGGMVLNTNTQIESSQLNSLDSALNGLFTPNAAEKFFREGREDFEEEIEIINKSEIYFDDNLLQIDKELIEKMQQTELNDKW